MKKNTLSYSKTAITKITLKDKNVIFCEIPYVISVKINYVNEDWATTARAFEVDFRSKTMINCIKSYKTFNYSFLPDLHFYIKILCDSSGCDL